MGHYYHVFANGVDSKNFITSESDFYAAFNRFGVCAAMFPCVRILAFSIEETHPHCLLFGEHDECLGFKLAYERSTRHYITSTRGCLNDVVLDLDMLEITDEEYLLNSLAYVIIQPTKDGKSVMPYDYRWGTGSLYFRQAGQPLIWQFRSDGTVAESVRFENLTYRERRKVLCSKSLIPNHWLISNGLILPSNYIDQTGFESIFRSFNRFRTFMSAGKKQMQAVTAGMADVRGVAMEDLEARELSVKVSFEMFGKKDARWLTQSQRLALATELRNRYRLTIRQTATLSRLPETEIRKYIR